MAKVTVPIRREDFSDDPISGPKVYRGLQNLVRAVEKLEREITIQIEEAPGYFELTDTERIIGSNAGTNNTGDRVIIGGLDAGLNNAANDVIILGKDAAPDLTSVGNNDGTFAMGTNALNALDASISSVGPNMAIGHNVMQTADSNFIRFNWVSGYNALSSDLQNQTVQQNTIAGHEACEFAQTNSVGAVTAFGYQVARGANSANTTPNGCSFFGSQSGLVITGPVQCSGFGNNSLRKLTNGIANSAFGHGAGDEIVSGDFNSVFGGLTSLWEGDANSVFGQGLGPGGQLGDGNSFFGQGCARGFAGTSTDHNIVLGRNAANLGIATNDSQKFIVASFGGASTVDLAFLWGEMEAANLLLSRAPNTTGLPTTQVPTGRNFNNAVGNLRFQDGTGPDTDPVAGFNGIWWDDSDGHFRSRQNGLGTTVGRLVKSEADQIILGTNAAGAMGIYWGSGTPEAAVTAGIGSTFHRSDGGAITSFYVKESGTGNTGWVAK